MAQAIASAAIMLSIPIVCLIAEALTRKFLNTNCSEMMYCVLPIYADTKDIELKLISLKTSLTRIKSAGFTVFITDFGADETTLKICEKYCIDNESFVMIEPEQLSILLNRTD